MSRRQKFQERRKQRFKKSVHRLLFSILLVLAGSFIYENMNFDLDFKGMIAHDEKVEHLHPQVSSVVKVNGSFDLEGPFAYSESFSPSVLANDVNRRNFFMKEHYRPIKTDKNQDLNEDDDKEEADGKEKTVYLTFDDGPNQFSEQLLDVLDSYDAKATFFLIDKNIRAYPDAVNQMVASGHSVGLHSVSHDVSIFYQSAASVIGEMNQVQSTVKEVAGIDTTLIRTPYGSVPHMKDSYVQAVHEHGYLMWDWNIDSKDWYYRDRRYVDHCIAQLQALDGSDSPLVILLHEREQTLTHLPALLEYLKAENYTMKAIESSMTPVAFK